MSSAKQYDWKCRMCVRTPKWLERQRSKASAMPRLPHRKSCLMLPPCCVRANLRMLKTRTRAFNMQMSSFKTPHPLSDVLPTAAPQERPRDFLKSSIHLLIQVFPRSPTPVGFHFQQSRYQCQLTRRMRMQLSHGARNCVPMPTLEAGTALEHARIPRQPHHDESIKTIRELYR